MPLCQALSPGHTLRLERMENKLKGPWQISPEDRAQMGRACLDWVLLEISHSVDVLHLNCGRADWMDELFLKQLWTETEDGTVLHLHWPFFHTTNSFWVLDLSFLLVFLLEYRVTDKSTGFRPREALVLVEVNDITIRLFCLIKSFRRRVLAGILHLM